jgi:hypothetical protein
MRSSDRLFFSGEKGAIPTHRVPQAVGAAKDVAALDALVRMKLTAFRLKDKVHLLDLMDVGLVDESWCDRLPPELGARLRELLDSREREA